MALEVVPYGLGVRHTGTWASGQRPQTPREGMFFLYPNGSVQLTGMLSKMKRKKPKDPKFSHYTKNLPQQGGLLSGSGVYDDRIMGTAYTAGVTAVGTIVYAKVAEVIAKEFREGHTALLIDSDDHRQNTHVSIVAVDVNGASSCISCKLLEATTAAAATGHEVTTADRIAVIGNALVEGGTIPDPVNYNPVELWNYCQIFWTPYSVTNTQLETELVTGDVLKEEKREKVELHGIEMEKAFLFGLRYKETVGDKEKRYTMGMLSMIQAYASDREYDFTLEAGAAFAGKSWLTAGMEWFDYVFGEVGQYGPTTRTVFCGQGAAIGITQLARAWGMIELKTRAAEWGINITEWLAPGGLRLQIRTHPLLSINPAYTNLMLVFPPENIEERPLRDTHVTRDDKNEGGNMAVDGIMEGWRTETGLWFNHPYTFAALWGVGLDNNL